MISKVLVICCLFLQVQIFLFSDGPVIPKKDVNLTNFPILSPLLVDKDKKKTKKENKAIEEIVTNVVSGSEDNLDKQAKELVADKQKLGEFLEKLPDILGGQKSSLLQCDFREVLQSQFNHKELVENKITLSFKNSPIEEAIELISKLSGLNFVLDPDVKGVIKNINLKNVPIVFALKTLFLNNQPQLTILKEFNIYRVTTLKKAQVILKEKFENSQENQFKKNVVTMKNVKFSEMFKLRVEKMWQSIIGSNSYKPGYYLVCDDESRKIFFRGKLRQVVEMKEFLREVDIDLPQVKIEVRLVIAHKDFEESFGFRWSGIYNRRASLGSGWGPIGFGPLGDVKNEPKEQSLVSLTDWALNLFSSKGDSSRTLHIPFIFGGKDLNTKRLNLVLNAAENKGELKTILKPSILTNHCEEAEMLVGDSIPIETIVQETIEGSLRDITTATYIDVGTILRVKPMVAPSRKSILLEIFVENSTHKIPAGQKYPTITKTRSKSRVALRNGQTTMIGGLIENSKTINQSKIPVLGDIPLVRFFFKGTRKEIKDHQLLIFITPTIV